jgi:hypothetical protein
MEEIFMFKRMLTFKGVPKHGWAIRQHSLNEERSDQRAPQRAEKGECNFVCAHHGQLLRPQRLLEEMLQPRQEHRLAQIRPLRREGVV